MPLEIQDLRQANPNSTAGANASYCSRRSRTADTACCILTDRLRGPKATPRECRVVTAGFDQFTGGGSQNTITRIEQPKYLTVGNTVNILSSAWFDANESTLQKTLQMIGSIRGTEARVLSQFTSGAWPFAEAQHQAEARWI